VSDDPLEVMIVLDRTGSMDGNLGLAILPPAKDRATVCSARQSSDYDGRRTSRLTGSVTPRRVSPRSG
jgi:hypothetical protein